MKRKVASRKFKRTCCICNRSFKKGDVYYSHRSVVTYGKLIDAHEFLRCAKCKYKNEKREDRFKEFIKNCHHPITEEVWSPIPGESHLLQPDHLECTICGKWL
jgi:hypothetical protein